MCICGEVCVCVESRFCKKFFVVFGLFSTGGVSYIEGGGVCVWKPIKRRGGASFPRITHDLCGLVYIRAGGVPFL